MKKILFILRTSSDSRSKYESACIQFYILNKGSNHPEPIGMLVWQGTVAERGKRKDYWYGMRMEVNMEFSKINRVSELLKVMQVIADSNVVEYGSAQPEDVAKFLEVKGAVRCGHYRGSIIPVSYEGIAKRYEVAQSGTGNVWCDIYAIDAKHALKQLTEMMKSGYAQHDHALNETAETVTGIDGL